MDDCIFCAIVQGKIPSAKVFESDKLYAFLDLNPANKGHTLLIPKEHCTNILDVDPIIGKEFLDAVQRIAPAIMHVTSAQGFNVFQNNGKVAGQEIFHLHWHIIPRFENDGVPLWKQGAYDSQEEMNRLAAAIKVQIS
ncbi:MAG: HIT family protein [Desulfovibrionaceae bacterium]|nr:HIT family protein [Desulfovibrionaceae bacterium]